MRAYRARGLAGLRPVARSDTGAVRRHPELLAEAAALRAELPARSSGAIADILLRRHGVAVAERTIRAHLRRLGLHRAAIGGAPRAFGRYEATRPNERWITDVLVGPSVPHPRAAGVAAGQALPDRRLMPTPRLCRQAVRVRSEALVQPTISAVSGRGRSA